MQLVRIFVCVFVFATFANAQKVTLTGRVLDPNGAVIPRIDIEAVSLKNERFKTVTRDDGIYSLLLMPGQYNIAINPHPVRMNGFETLKISKYTVASADDRRMNLDISLKIFGNGVICELIVGPSTSKKAKTRRRK